MLGWMCPDATQCRQGSLDAPDATRCGVWVQDAQDAKDAGSRWGEAGRNTTVSDTGHLFADARPGRGSRGGWAAIDRHIQGVLTRWDSGGRSGQAG